MRAALLAAGLLAGSGARAAEDWPAPMEDRMLFGMALFDQLEYVYGPEGAGMAWDAEGWLGGDYNRLRLRSEGGLALPEAGVEGEVQGLYSRLIAPYWELQAGARYELPAGAAFEPGQLHGALGIEGTAPYWFDLEATLFVSGSGEPSARLSAIHEQRFTQRLVGQARLESDLALRSVGLGLGYRLRYEIRRELAPYLGVTWQRVFGEVVEDPGGVAGAAGLRLWF